MVKLVAKTCINWALEITAITSCAWPLHGWGHGGCYSEAVGCWVMDLSFFRCIHTPLRVQSRVSNAGCAMQIMLSMLPSCGFWSFLAFGVWSTANKAETRRFNSSKSFVTMCWWWHRDKEGKFDDGKSAMPLQLKKCS